MKKWLVLTLLFPALGYGFPRNPFPKNSDQVWQNDKDLDSSIKKSKFSIQNSSNPSTSTQVFSVSTAIVNDQLTIPGIFTVNSAGSWSLNTLVVKTDSSGNVTQPLQSSFLVTHSVEQTDVTGDGTAVTVAFTNEIYDQGNNIINSTFTAPITGRYFLSSCVTLKGIASGHTFKEIQMVTSNRTYAFDFSNSIVSDFQGICTPPVIADMDLADTAFVRINATGSTKTIDIIGDASYSMFSGSLIN